MVGAFGLLDGYHPSLFPGDRIVENVPRLDIWHLLQTGALVEGVVTELAIGDPVGSRWPASEPSICRVVRESPHVWINETRVAVAWDEPMPGVGRPWFLCPCGCGRRARFLYLVRDMIRAAPCLGLQHASRHLHRQMPGIHRIARWRRQIGAEERPFGLIPERPRHHTRFHSIADRIRSEEAKLVVYLGSIVYDLDRRLRGRRGRKRYDRAQATPRPDPA